MLILSPCIVCTRSMNDPPGIPAFHRREKHSSQYMYPINGFSYVNTLK